MKRFIVLLLSFALVLGLCACGNQNASTTDDSDGAEKYVGTTWVADNIIADLRSFRLLPDGKMIWKDGSYYAYEGEEPLPLVTDQARVYFGEWIYDEERIILFFPDYGPDGDGAYAYNLRIIGDVLEYQYYDTLFIGYTKVE